MISLSPFADGSRKGTALVQDGLTVIAVLEPLRVAILDALHAVESIRAHRLAPKV